MIQEPKTNEYQIYRSQKRMDIKSTRAKNEWILNLQESKTNEYQIYKSPKWMNLQYRRAQNEWISNLLSVDVEDGSVGGEDRRGRGACLCLICGKLIGLSAGQYIGYQGHCKSFSSPGTSSTSGPARRQITSCSREAMYHVTCLSLTWHVSCSLWHGRLAWHRNSYTSTSFLMTFRYSRLWFSTSEQDKNSNGYKFPETCFFPPFVNKNNKSFVSRKFCHCSRSILMVPRGV